MIVATLDYRNTDYGLMNQFASIAVGVSDAAKAITNKLRDISSANLKTVRGIQEASLSSKAFSGLIELIESGENIPFDIFNESINFLRNLPSNFEVPDISTEPSGAVTFEWYKEPFKVFVISINGTNTLEFAALAGKGNEWHGKMNYLDQMPPEMKALLKIFLTA